MARAEDVDLALEFGRAALDQSSHHRVGRTRTCLVQETPVASRDLNLDARPSTGKAILRRAPSTDRLDSGDEGRKVGRPRSHVQSHSVWPQVVGADEAALEDEHDFIGDCEPLDFGVVRLRGALSARDIRGENAGGRAEGRPFDAAERHATDAETAAIDRGCEGAASAFFGLEANGHRASVSAGSGQALKVASTMTSEGAAASRRRACTGRSRRRS